MNRADRGDPAPTNQADDVDIGDTALDRAQLIVTMLEAAGSAAVGADRRAADEALRGRRFEMRMRFGCPGGQPSTQRNWSFDQATGALKVAVEPDIDEDIAADDTAAADGNSVAAAESHRAGFLVDSPTVLAEGCPTSEFAAAAGFTNLRFGLVQTTDPQAPRSRQLLDSYQIVKKIAPEAGPTNGLDLLLSGRLEPPLGGPTVACKPRGAVIECLAAATFDRVAIEDPASRRLIAEWGAR